MREVSGTKLFLDEIISWIGRSNAEILQVNGRNSSTAGYHIVQSGKTPLINGTTYQNLATINRLPIRT
ncbi:hypothetical protein IGI53_000294 [Enterococcus sp. DIV0788_1]